MSDLEHARAEVLVAAAAFGRARQRLRAMGVAVDVAAVEAARALLSEAAERYALALEPRDPGPPDPFWREQSHRR